MSSVPEKLHFSFYFYFNYFKFAFKGEAGWLLVPLKQSLEYWHNFIALSQLRFTLYKAAHKILLHLGVHVKWLCDFKYYPKHITDLVGVNRMIQFKCLFLCINLLCCNMFTRMLYADNMSYEHANAIVAGN